MYHRNCRVNFADPSLGIPKIFANKLETPIVKKGRPCNDKLIEAFNMTMSFFEKNEEENLTVSDLARKMSEHLNESEVEGYTNKYMKTKMIETYGDELIISSSEGRSDVVNLKLNVNKIISKFRNNSENTDSNETTGDSIIETAAKLIKADIKSVVQDKSTFPSSNELTEENAIIFVPQSLKRLLEVIFSGGGNATNVGFIGLAIMQACRPRSLICPLQFGIVVQFHNFFQSRFIVDELHEAGFCSSYWTCEKFENCAAIYQGTHLSTLENNTEETYAVQYMAENIDHNMANLDGRNTLHAMGMMATITPARKIVSKIPILPNVTKDDVIAISKVDIPEYMFSDYVSPSIQLLSLTTANPIADVY